MTSDKTASVLYAQQNGNQIPLAPETDATQVYIAAEDGSASNVNAEIINLRTVINSTLTNGVQFKGSLTSTNGLPTVAYQAGWQYVVEESGTYAGVRCEVGDMIICINSYVAGSASNADWNVLQVNIVGAVSGPASAVAQHVAVFNGTTGKVIADSGFTLGTSVPANALFTDTTYDLATDTTAGLMSAADKTKLDGIEAGADVTDAANVAAAGAFMTATMTSDNIQQGSSNLFMTTAQQTKLNGIEAGAQKNQNAYSTIVAGGVSLSAASPSDSVSIAAGSGITVTGSTASGNTVTVSETYIDTCVVSSLSSVPSNLRDGGLIVLLSS